MSADYRYLIVDASTGLALCEAPFDQVQFSRLLTAVGEFTGTLPLDHPTATTANLIGDREITVLRDDLAVWNGPVTGVDPDLSSRSVAVTAREASWYLGKRTVEVDKHYNADTHSIVRKLVTYMTSKTDGGSINATLPRFSVSSGRSGVTKTLLLFGRARHLVSEAIQVLIDDPDAGLEYRMDYQTGSTRQSCHRTLTLGSPLGVTRSRLLAEAVLYDYGRTNDWEDGATRVHVVGSGYTATKQNTGSVSAGTLLIESVFDRSDISNHTHLDNTAREARRRAQPPVRSYAASYVPGGALPFGWCDLGDTVTFATTGPALLALSASRRVVSETTVPPSGDAPEVVSWEFNLPLTDLGA